MKKQNLFKIILFCLLAYTLLSWFIEAGTVSGSEVVTQGITRIGIRDLTLYSLLSIEFRAAHILFLLVVGAFYGILSKSKSYANLVSKLSKKTKGIGWGVLVIVPLALILLKVILSSVLLPLWLKIVLPMVDVIGSGLLVWYGLKDNKDKMASLFGALSVLPVSVSVILLTVLPSMPAWLSTLVVILGLALSIILIVLGVKKTDKKEGIYRSLFIVLPTSLVLTLGISGLTDNIAVILVSLFAMIVISAFLVKFVNTNDRVSLLVISILFILLTAVCGFNVMAFIFIPFFISIVIEMGYNRMSAFLVTFASTMVGTIGSIFNYSVNGYLNGYASIEGFTSDIIAKLAIFVVPTVLYLFFVDKYASSKKTDKEDEEANKDVFELSTKDNKSRVLGISIVLGLTFVVTLLAVTNWSYVFGINLFQTVTDKVLAFKIGGHTVLNYLLGNFVAFGGYSVEEISILLAFAAFVVILVSRMKFSEAKEGMLEGIKKMIVPAVVVAFASALFLLSYYISPFANTIEGWLIGLSKNFNVLAIFTSSIDALFATFICGEPTAFVQQALPIALSTYEGNANMLVLIFQSMFGIGSMVLPTSMVLVLGLEYLNIPYTKWIKTAWKTLLEIFVVLLIILIVFHLV